MGFVKWTFPIQNISQASERIEIVTGWKSGDFGFHKVKKMWVATDLCSGTRVCKFPTRKECLAWCEENAALIETRRLEPSYITMVMSFRQFIEEELKNLV